MSIPINQAPYSSQNKRTKKTLWRKVLRDVAAHKYLYLMGIPVLAYYLVFHYLPVFGGIIAFKDFRPGLGIWGSPWVGFKHFESFFTSIYFWRLIRNTILISVYSLLFTFPLPIIFALMINEVKNRYFKSAVQTITYMPRFLSAVVVSGIIINFVATDGLINDIYVFFGGERLNLLVNPDAFRSIYISSNVWTDLGWGSIIYLAAISGVDPSLYEASTIDGANRFKQALHVTLPGIAPVIIILLILNIGTMLNVGWERIMLLYNPTIYETADVIQTYVYRRGLQETDYSYATAIGLFNSVVNFILLVTANKISKKISSSSLW